MSLIPCRKHSWIFYSLAIVVLWQGILFYEIFLPIHWRSENRSCGAEPNPITSERRITHDGLFKQRPAWSPDGRTLVYAAHDGDRILLYRQEIPTGKPVRLTDRKDPEYDAVFRPDGEEIVFSLVKVSGAQGDVDVYRLPLDGSEPLPLAVTEEKLSHEEYPSYSADGQQVVYSSTREGNQELFTIELSSHTTQRLTNDPGLDTHASWSPNGKQIVFATDRWGDLELAIMDHDGSNLRRVTESPALDDYPTWSPNGEQIAFVSNRDGNFEIYILEVNSKTVRNATQHPGRDTFPSWSPRGELTWVSNRAGGFDVYLQTPSTSKQ